MASPMRLLKRARSSSNDRMSMEQILKACKRSDPASPHSPVGSAPVTTTPEAPATAAAATEASVSPLLQACSSMKSAIPFLQNSRRHALSLLLQNQCERALMVLEKIERANDMISRQRRRVVLQQANAIHKLNTERQANAPAVAEQDKTTKKPARRVCFSEIVTVVDVETMDRSPAPMPPLIREEILVLRASRPIPISNFSELWH
uniref:Uncharacterized protein n=1 Tax=Globisporangium ultimum (strain ATCC 200006 / CBS 805.95 / DAOM BR144) TaxID=431595 RepID=K3WGJ0_GLOUD